MTLNEQIKDLVLRDFKMAGKSAADTIRIKKIFNERIEDLKAKGITENKNTDTGEVLNLKIARNAITFLAEHLIRR